MNWRVAISAWFAGIHAANVGTHLKESIWSEYGISMAIGLLFAFAAARFWESEETR